MKNYYTLILKTYVFSLFFCLISVSSSSQVIVKSHTFSQDLEGWVATGSLSGRNFNTNSCSSLGAIFVYYGFGGNNGIMTSPTYDITGYNQIDISFCHINSDGNQENGDAFDLQYFNGTNWSLLRRYTRGIDYFGGGPGDATNLSATINTGSFTFSTNSRFRFVSRNSASDEWNVFDDILITSPNCGSASINTFPYNEGFETGLGAWNQDINDDNDWTRDGFGTPSPGTGPSVAHEGSFYMFTEASNPNFNDTFNLVSPCFDLTSETSANFSFYYHMFGADMGDLFVEVSTNNGNTFTTLLTLSGQSQTSNAQNWNQANINLAAYLGSTIIIRFRGETGADFRGDMAIDDISLVTSITSSPEINITDSASNNITDGGGNSPALANSTIFGNSNIGSSITQTYTIENSGSGNLNISSWTSSNADFTISSAPATSVSAGSSTTFVVTFTPTTSGTINSVITINNNDSDEGVYTFDVQGVGVISTNTPPEYTIYYEHFDENDGGWTTTGSGTVWARGTGLTAVSELGEGNYWYTNNYNDYTPSSFTTLVSPIISTLGYENIEFSADVRYNLDADTDDGMAVQYRKRTSGTWSSWTILGASGSGTNWYDGTNVTAIGSGSNGWTGTTTTTQAIENHFRTSKLFLPATLHNSDEIQLRFVFASDSDAVVDDGAAVDNILIYADPITPFADPSFGPGSVNADLKLWLKATNEWNVLSDNTDIISWTDSAFDNNATSTAVARPAFKDNASDNINFNPVIEFDRSNSEFMRGKGGFFAQDYFVVIKSNGSIDNNTSNRQVPIAGRVAPVSPQVDGTGLGLGNISLRFSNEVVAHMSSSVPTSPGPDSYGRAYTSTTDSYLDEVIIYNIKSNATGTGSEIYKNGKRIDNTIGQAYNQTTSSFNGDLNFYEFLNQQYYLGVGRFTLNGNVDAFVDGRMTEIISYNNSNSSLNQQKIQSYLALKNGVTLHAPNSTAENRLNDVDYIDTQGTVIWDTSANIGYNFDIAGIGRDDASEFIQKQSASENKFSDSTGPTSGFLSMSLTEVYDTNKENIDNNSTTFNDREFLTWGNNNASLDATPSTIDVDMSAGILPAGSIATNVSFIGMQRIWKVVETGNVGRVKVSIPQNAVRNITPPGNYFMFISETGVFNPTAQYRLMTADGNGNLVADYDFNNTKFITFGYAPEIIVERSVKFVQNQLNYIDVEDNLDLDGNFTISAWIKRDPNSTNTSIIAKRDLSYTQGYDLKITTAGRTEMSWMNGTMSNIESSVIIPEGIWHHIAVTHDGSDARLYIDGVLNRTENIPPPVNTTQSFLIGAAGRESSAGSYFNGNIDEVRVWNTALLETEIRFLMNQELENNTHIGKYFNNRSIVPTKNDIVALNFNDLEGYFPMSRYTYTNTNDESGNELTGYLRQLRTVDFQTAPLPYVSEQNGDWTDSATWRNGAMQTIPGARSLANNEVSVDWNIVQTSHDIAIDNMSSLFDDTLVNLPDPDNNDNEGNRTVLAHLVDAGTITLTGDNTTKTGNGYTVTHYLGLDGKIDLEGESQLIQDIDSDLVVGNVGALEKDQQGTTNTFHYNYWSSPIGATSMDPSGMDNENRYSYAVSSVMKDREFNVNFSGTGFDGAPGTAATPITIADYWIWKYADHPSGDYSSWEHVRRTGTILAGEGFTMKGPGSSGTEQNYTFLGKPNNADINLTISQYYDYLVGNPYASAIDADQFIIDNAPTLLFEENGTTPELDAPTSGTLYFWEHWGGASHILAQYQGGYATYNLAGGASAPFGLLGVNDPDVGPGGTPTKTPGRYIPVGQGFFVVADIGGTINFNNGQRVFKKESNANGEFVRTAQTTNSNNRTDEVDYRQKIKLGFDSVGNQHRQLLLTIDERTSATVDWGFDGNAYDYLNDDMFWLIENDFFVIQASDNMDAGTSYPLVIYTSTDGNNTIKIDELINIDSNQDIFLHDIDLGLYHNLRESDYQVFLNAGYFDARFELVFANQNNILNTDDIAIVENSLDVRYSNSIDKVVLINPHSISVDRIEVYNILGQQITTITEIKSGTTTEYNVGNLSSGAYIIKLNTESGSVSKKVLVD